MGTIVKRLARLLADFFRFMAGPIIGFVIVAGLWGYRSFSACEQIVRIDSFGSAQVANNQESRSDDSDEVTRRKNELLRVAYEQKNEQGGKLTQWRVFRSILPWLGVECIVCGMLALIFPALEYVSNREHRNGKRQHRERVRYLSRFALCALLATGWVYVFSPGGLGSSAIDIYLRWRDPLRLSDIPVWMYHSEKAPLFCTAFLGFYVYSLTVWLSRFYSSDITRGLYLGLLKRGLIVLIFALVVSTDPTSPGKPPVFSRLAIFLTGVFPQSVITLAKSKVGEKGGAFLDDKSVPLTEISSLSVTQQTRLEEEGITSASDLACADLLTLAHSTSFDERMLARWCDEAMLLSHVGSEKFSKLKRESISRATELVQFVEVHNHHRDAAVGDLEKRVEQHNINFLAEALKKEANFASLDSLYKAQTGVILQTGAGGL